MSELDSLRYAIRAGFHSPALQRMITADEQIAEAEAVLTAMVGEDRIDDVMLEVERRQASIAVVFAASPRLAALKSVAYDAAAGTL